nr:VC_2705 family sodium/solute symporter [Alphaproteobacteria bacterium]
ILIIAYLTPVVILSAQRYGLPIPQLTYGLALAEIANIEPSLGITSDKAYATPFTIYSPLNFFALIFCLMLGTASLPHVLMRFFTTPSVKAARRSVGWALFFIFLLYFTAPAYAAFAKLEIYSNVLGASIVDLPGWVQSWGPQGVGLISINDINGDGILQNAEFVISRDVVVLSTPEIAGLPYVVSGLVAAGGLAAALSTADGLLLAIANAFSHDVYYRMINSEANTKTRLTVARIILVVVAIAAAFTATFAPPNILTLVAWAFSLAAGGLFPALVLGIWSTRINSQGAIAGMIVGFGVTLFYLAGTQYFGMGKWFGLNNISAGLFGVPLNFIVSIVVSKMTATPSEDMQRFIRSLRHPRGGTLMEEKAES